MTNDQQKLRVEIQELEEKISQKQQKLNEILDIRTPKIGSNTGTILKNECKKCF